jgi:hypothetical protein
MKQRSLSGMRWMRMSASRLLTLVVLASPGMASAAMAPAGFAAEAPDYFPLEKGSKWTYKMSNGMEMTLQVIGFQEVGGVRCAALETTMGLQKSVEYLAADAEGVKAYKMQAGGQEMFRRNARQAQLNRNLQNSIAEANKAFDGYLDSLQNASRSRDYQGWVRSQTTLGQGTWVAENEGARVYQTDSWGIQGPEGRVDHPEYNTTHFTGESPWGGRLEQVDTREEYEKYIEGR